MEKFILCFFSFILAVNSVHAQSFDVMQEAPENSPVEVYGSANLGHSQSNAVLLTQQSDENPLGNPIVLGRGRSSGVSSFPVLSPTVPPTMPSGVVRENLQQNPMISPQEMPQIVNKQIQNTLYYSGGRIYDIQSYPARDIDYIETPNLDRTITTYPAY